MLAKLVAEAMDRVPRVAVRRRDLDLRAYRYRSAKTTDYSQLVEEPVILTEGGRVTVVYLHLTALGLDLAPLVARLKTIQYEESRRTEGLVTTSRVFGFEPRKTLRKDFCAAVSLATEDPAAHAELVRAGHLCEAIYAQAAPTLYQRHVDAVVNGDQPIRELWRLAGGIFTSGIVNHNNPLPYHFDSGNVKGVWSSMLVFKGGGVGGGYLSVPQYDMGFALPDHSLFLFDGQGLLHGVTPIDRSAGEASYRYSVVYYSLQQMWRCDTPAGELDRIKAVKTERERERAGLPRRVP